MARSKINYVPGMYAVKRSNPSEIAGRYIWEWEQKRSKIKTEKPAQDMPPAICFSRKIGVGALEVADILSQKTGFRVHDRTLLSYIAQEAKIREQTVAIFDEIYPGKTIEMMRFFVCDKSFIKSDYARHLFRVIISLAFLESAIFVGRGAYLILPRDRILAVRFISSREHRIKRLARIMNVGEEEADRRIDQIDKEQHDFFKKVFKKKDITPDEFDLVINFDYIKNPRCAAEIVAFAFADKFGSEMAITKFFSSSKV